MGLFITLPGEAWLFFLLPGEDLFKRMDFDSFKYTMGDIGITVGNAFGLLHGVRLDEDQTSGFIRKGSGTDQSALLL